VNEALATRSITIRDLTLDDLDSVVRIDALHAGEAKRPYWTRVLGDLVTNGRSGKQVSLAAIGADGSLTGYLLGEVRAFEFGSEACGWILSVGVDPGHEREGIATALLRAAASTFRSWGLATARTMVGRSDIPVLSFFRANGFSGGSFYQLEIDLSEAEP